MLSLLLIWCLLLAAVRAAGPGTTLQPGFKWIRSVTQPNFHKYLQSKPAYSPSIAYMDNYKTAGQFNIDSSGQLVQLISGPKEPRKVLYAIVTTTATHKNKTLIATFHELKNTHGKFALQGDTVIWKSGSSLDQQRKNFAAFYICENQKLYVNMGQFLAGKGWKPEGCSDHTIHLYTDKTANA